MTKGMGNNILRYIQRGCDGRPGMASDIGRQHRESRTEHPHLPIDTQLIGSPFLNSRADGLQATTELVGEGGIVLSVFPPANEATKTAVVLFNEGSSLGFHLHIIESPSLGATIGKATINQLVSIQSQEVNQINTDETEGELEGIHILLLPRFDMIGEEGTKNLHRHGSLFGRLGFYLEGTERIPRSHTIVYGIIEDSPNISQMDGASIHGRTATSLRTKPSFEPREPILGYHFKGERLGMRIESQHLFNGHLIDFTGPLGLAKGGIGTETSQEQILRTSIRTQLGSHTILHLDGRQADQITSISQF